jgi:hypothetical protein
MVNRTEEVIKRVRSVLSGITVGRGTF